jgi:hypothetical protein
LKIHYKISNIDIEEIDLFYKYIQLIGNNLAGENWKNNHPIKKEYGYNKKIWYFYFNCKNENIFFSTEFWEY